MGRVSSSLHWCGPHHRYAHRALHGRRLASSLGQRLGFLPLHLFLSQHHPSHRSSTLRREDLTQKEPLPCRWVGARQQSLPANNSVLSLLAAEHQKKKKIVPNTLTMTMITILTFLSLFDLLISGILALADALKSVLLFAVRSIGIMDALQAILFAKWQSRTSWIRLIGFVLSANSWHLGTQLRPEEVDLLLRDLGRLIAGGKSPTYGRPKEWRGQENLLLLCRISTENTCLSSLR